MSVPHAALAQLSGAAELDQAIRGLTVTGRVLVIAAHPDDEDTQTIAWLARGKRVETAYLSLTRGDGGQNLIGNQLGESLGAIRTEELLAARRIDGGRQYFTRAYDFGFSKNADETAKHWPRDSILGDVVTVIRAFRPHLIYSIWSGTRADGHGHHETAGIVAREAFDAAGDTARFPARRFGAPWEPQKFYRRGPGIAIDANAYDAVLGRTYADIAADSRSQHRSQGFAGVALRSIVPGGGGRGGRGGGPSGGALIRSATRVNASVAPADERSIFDGIDTTFRRLINAAPDSVRADLSRVLAQADSAMARIDLKVPSRIAPVVARLTAGLQSIRRRLPDCDMRARMGGFRRVRDQEAWCSPAELDLTASLATIERRAERAVVASAEIEIQAVAPRETVAFGDSARVTIAVVNHGQSPVTVTNVRVTGGPRSGFRSVTLAPDSGVAIPQRVIGYPDLRPWWIGGKREEGLFNFKRSPADGIARVSATSADLIPSVAVSEEMRRMSDVRVTLDIAGSTIEANAGPLIYPSADPLLGVQDRPIGGVPPVTLEFDRNLEWMPAGKPIDRMLRLTIKSFSDGPQTFALRVVAPKDIRVDSVPPSVTIGAREQREVFVRIRGALKSGRYEFGAVGEYSTGARFAEGFSSIIYPHIRPIYQYRSSGIYFQAVDIDVPTRLTVAYVQGVGDDNAVFLRQLGIPVTVISPSELPAWDLSRFSTVVVGTRAFDANRALVAYAPRLMDFARNGGTLVVQYGQSLGSIPAVLPYPMTWEGRAERVTVEDAPVAILDPKSKLLTFPNRIGEDDWKDWVQERALYMPSAIDSRYATPLEMHDPDEAPNKGAIVTTPVGRGVYVFTSLALFRQLPAAVPGSARLFVNILSAGVPQTQRTTP